MILSRLGCLTPLFNFASDHAAAGAWRFGLESWTGLKRITKWLYFHHGPSFGNYGDGVETGAAQKEDFEKLGDGFSWGAGDVFCAVGGRWWD